MSEFEEYLTLRKEEERIERELPKLEKRFEKDILEAITNKDLAEAIIEGWKGLDYEEKKKIIKHLNKHRKDFQKIVDFLKEQGEIKQNAKYDIGIFLATMPILTGLCLTSLPIDISFMLGTGISSILTFLMSPYTPEFKKFIDNVKSHIGFKKYIKKLEQKIPKLISTIEERAKGVLHKII